MKTTNQITATLQAMMKAMFAKASQGNAGIQLTDDMLDGFRELASQQPAIYPFFLKSLPSSAEVASYFESISQHENDRMTMPDIPVAYFKDNLQGKDVFTPAYLPWQTTENKAKNFIINYNASSAERAAEIYRHMVMSILLGLPPKSVHLSFVNTQFSSLDNFFTSELNESLYEIITTSEYRQLLTRLQNRMIDFKKKYGSTIEQENENAGKIVEPYEVVILLDDPDSEISAQEQLIPLFKMGPEYGIYFIGLNNTEKGAQREDQDHVLKYTDSYQTIEAGTVNPWSASQEGGFITTMSIANNSVWAKAAFEHINAAATRKKVFKFDWQTAINAPYTETDNEIVAPIGFTSEGNLVNFRMDQSAHVHAFLIGDTGSGKSRFLHALILSLTAKYSPEDLELYLLDFKGVELNCYRKLTHSRAILVSEADQRITYEVLYDIRRQMEERRQLLEQADAKDVKEYNAKQKNNRLSQIILIIDECQEIFKDNTSNIKLQDEMVDIIRSIATKGRSNGIHMLLSTQSLANTDHRLDKGIRNLIQEHYILPCVEEDAKKIVKDHQQNQTAKVVAEMEKNKGQCYYVGEKDNVFFTFNYVDKTNMQSALVESIANKASQYPTKGQVYFSGALQFHITQSLADYIATKGRKNIVASPGQNISLDQNPLTITLDDDRKENIVLFGLNDKGKRFVTQTTLSLIMTLMISNKQKQLGYRCLIFNCYKDEDAAYLDILDELENEHLCEVVKPRNRVRILKQLCDDIASSNAAPTLLVILGQEVFSDLEDNLSIDEGADTSGNFTLPASNDISGTLAMMANIGHNSTHNNGLSSVKTTQDALKYIMSKGPINKVHTILQVVEPNKFLFQKNSALNREDLYSICKHIILMRSEYTALNSLCLRPDIQDAIPLFKDDPNRLRAYYYSKEGDFYQLFTPFVLPDKDTKNNIIK